MLILRLEIDRSGSRDEASNNMFRWGLESVNIFWPVPDPRGSLGNISTAGSMTSNATRQYYLICKYIERPSWKTDITGIPLKGNKICLLSCMSPPRILAMECIITSLNSCRYFHLLSMIIPSELGLLMNFDLKFSFLTWGGHVTKPPHPSSRCRAIFYRRQVTIVMVQAVRIQCTQTSTNWGVSRTKAIRIHQGHNPCLHVRTGAPNGFIPACCRPHLLLALLDMS